MSVTVPAIRVEARGLVERRGTDEDARGAIVALTAKGRATLKAATPAHLASVREHLIDRLSPDEIRPLDRIAGKIIRHLDGWSHTLPRLGAARGSAAPMESRSPAGYSCSVRVTA